MRKHLLLYLFFPLALALPGNGGNVESVAPQTLPPPLTPPPPSTPRINGPAVDFYMKPLADGSHALGIFNRGEQAVQIGTNKLKKAMGMGDNVIARDLWRQKDIPHFRPLKSTFTIPASGVLLLKLSPKR